MPRALLLLGGAGAAAYFLSDKTRREALFRKAEALKGPLTDFADRAAEMMRSAQGAAGSQQRSNREDTLLAG